MIESQNRTSVGRGFGIKFAAFCLVFVTAMFAVASISGQAVPAERVRVEPGKYDNPNESKLGVLGDSEYKKDLFEFLNPSNNLITAATYVFSTQTSIALEDMSSGTTQLVAAAQDDTASAVTNIGFDFWYDGVRFSQFSCNANGVCRLGSAAVATTFTNLLASTTNAPKIAPYFDDLWVGTNGIVRFKVVGSPGSRKLVVEWNNMTIPRQAAATTGAGTFQMWLYESSHPTLGGVIQFVYGNGIVLNSANAGYSVGLQSGAATNFASVTTLADTVSYAAANDAQSDSITPGKSYLFTPNIPIAPSGINFTAVGPLSMTVNWADMSSNEFGFAVYRSTDGVNFSFAGQTAANATSLGETGLNPSTNYTYRVYAVTEGAFSSPALEGSQMTGAPGNDTCAAAGGNWDATATWTDGTVPTAGDNVTIGSGCTVTVNVANAVALNVTVDSGGILQSPTTGTVITNNLSVGGNVTNNGTLDFSTNGDTSGAILTFGAGGNNVTFGGSGATTDVRAITIAKGAQSTVVEMMPANFTVRGVNTDVAGYLTLTSGTFKISGAYAIANRTFTTATYVIPALGGIWLNNPNYVVSGQAGGTTCSNSGLFRMTQGVYNIGLTGADGMGGGTGAVFNIEGGTVNATRIDPQSAVTWTQSAGTINISPTTGNTRSAFGSFELFSTTSVFNMSGGVVNLVNASVGATPVDYQVRSGTINYTGGVVNVGTAATATNFNFRLRGNAPSVVVDNTANAKTATFTAQTLIRGNVTVNTGTTFDIGGFLVAPFGAFPTSFVNNGAVIGNTAGSRLYLNSDNLITVSGSGTFGTSGSPLQSIDFDSAVGVTLNQSNQVITLRTIMFRGNVTNSGKITLGDGGAGTGVVQIGNTTTPTSAGVYDAPYTFNIGTGGQILVYLRTTDPRSTGPEITTVRNITSLTLDDNAMDRTLTLTGGNLTVTGALTLTNGILATLGNILDHNGAAARTNGYVNGNLRRLYSATGAYTYHVGQNGYSPVAANVTATTLGGSPSLLVRANDATLAGLNSATSVSRNWTLTESNSMTADLSFTYLDADVNGNEADYRLFKLDSGMLSNQCPGGPCVVEATNTASVTGITNFSDWGIGEATAGAAGVLAFSGPTYMTAENSGPATITVNRTGGSGGAVSIDYALTNGTATGGATCAPGIDYVFTGGTVNFASGEMSKTFDVPLCGDTVVEPDETVNLTLSNPLGGATIGAQNTAVLTILNDDTAVSNVNVNPGNGNYATLKEAFDAINAGTHTGAITVNINASTTEIDSAVLNSSGAGSASYTSISVRPAADGVSVSGPTVTGRGLIELNGADNVTIDGDNPNTAGTNKDLTLQNTAANTVTFTSVIRIAMNTTTVTSADNDIFRNLIIIGSATGRNIATETSAASVANTTYGFVATGNASGATTAPTALTSVTTTIGAGATGLNLMCYNNVFRTVGRGVAVQGSVTSVFPGLVINTNVIGNPTAGDADQVYNHGILAQGSADGIISGNEIYVEGFIGSSGTSATVGINVSPITTGAAGGTFTVQNNKVLRARNSNPASWAAQGINLGGGVNHVVQNNFVSDVKNSQVAGTGAFSTTFGAFGIRVGTGTGHKVYHNSVHLFGVLPGTVSTDLTAALAIVGTGQTGVDVRNNILSNQMTGGNPTGTRHVSIYLPTGATSAMNLTLNNSDYFSGTDPNSRLAQRGTTFGTGEFTAADFDPTMTTPATNFRSYSSTLSAAGTNDNASKKVDPLFVSDANLHIQPASSMNGMGIAVGVTDDIDGDTRETPPDIGADEIPTPVGPGTLALSSATYSVSEANPTVAITVNRSLGTTGAVSVNYALTDGTATGGATCGAGIDYINTGGTVNYADTEASKMFNVTICPDTTNKADETFNVTLSNPTGGAVLGSPAMAVVTILNDDTPPFSGTFTVGAGGDYASLTNSGGIFEAINSLGAVGSVTIHIISNLTGETGTVALNEIAGGFSVTVRPFGAARSITGSNATSLIKLSGADNVTIDGSIVVSPVTGANDRSLTITNTGIGAIVWIATNATSGANNVTLKNTNLVGAGNFTGQGVIAGSGTTFGGAAEFPNSNNTIQNNSFVRVQNAAFAVGNATTRDQNWLITQNDVGSTVVADKLNFRGFLISNSENFEISQNLISGINSSAATSSTMSGIHLTGFINGGLVTRNEIKDIRQNNTVGFGSNGIFITATSTASNVLIANNFISDISSVGFNGVGSSDNGYGIMINSGSGYKVYFNTVNMNTDQTAPGSITSAVNIALGITAVGAIDLRNNILANTQTIGTRFGVINSSAQAATVLSSINYNDYFAQNVGRQGTTAFPTLMDWQGATSQDANSQAVDPLFVSSTDLHLQPMSPVLDDGTPIGAVTDDFDGDTRSLTTPDIGADEIGAGPSAGVLQFSSATYSGGEGSGMITVTVNRTGGTAGIVGVNYATSNGSATGGAACTAGVDYINNSGTLMFGDGMTSQTFDVGVCEDALGEGDETVNLGISMPTGGATIGTQNTAVMTITDNDPPAGDFSVNDVRVTEGNAGIVNATFTVTYTGTGVASVNYATSNGTATAGIDYAAVMGTLNFGPLPVGQANSIPFHTVSVAVNGDTLKEANEFFFLNLSNPVNGTISDAQGAGVIVDEDRSYVADFDNDKISDFSVYRPSTGTWYVRQSTNGIPKIDVLGTTGDIAVPGDYDGDGITDRAIFRPSTGDWYVVKSQGKALTIQNFGLSGDKPVQGDYDGDGKTDFAVYRPSNGKWYVLQSTAGWSETFFGISTDIPVTGDYDGDAKNDLAVYRDGVWYILRSSDGGFQVGFWGLSTDKPVSGDFDGDGRTDLAIYRDGVWWVLDSLTNTSRVFNFGLPTDIPVVADYDRDGTSDIAVFRPSDGNWYFLRSSDLAFSAIHWGQNNDVPIPRAYTP